MNDFTIGRKAGAGMVKKQPGGGGGAQKFGSQRGRKEDGDVSFSGFSFNGEVNRLKECPTV